MHSIRIPCTSATACIVGQAEGTLMFVAVFIVAIIATTLTLHIRKQTKQKEHVIETHSTPGKEIKIDIPNQVSLHDPALQKTPEVRDTSCYTGGTSPKMKNEEKEGLSRFPGKQSTIDIPDPVSVLDISSFSIGQILANKVESNESAATTDQSNMDMPDTDSILHQSLIAGQETSSFHIEQPNNLLLQARTTSAIQIDNTGVASQTPQQPAQATTVAESQAQVPELKTAVKVALLVIPISVGGIFSVVAGLIEDNNTGLTHKVFFKAYVSLSYISFFSSVILFLLTLMPPRLPRLVMIVKITMWFTLLSIAYAIGCATCVLLLKSLVEVVLVLVAPLAVVFVLIILSLSSPRN